MKLDSSCDYLISKFFYAGNEINFVKINGKFVIKQKDSIVQNYFNSFNEVKLERDREKLIQIEQIREIKIKNQKNKKIDWNESSDKKSQNNQQWKPVQRSV